MVSALRRARKEGKLDRIAYGFDKMLEMLMRFDGVIYSKHHLQKPKTIVTYLSR